jgi:hypothetical protein
MDAKNIAADPIDVDSYAEAGFSQTSYASTTDGDSVNLRVPAATYVHFKSAIMRRTFLKDVTSGFRTNGREIHRREWICGQCDICFLSVDDFKKHYIKEYKTCADDQLDIMSERQKRAVESSQQCPLCHEEHEPRKLRSHTACAYDASIHA